MTPGEGGGGGGESRAHVKSCTNYDSEEVCQSYIGHSSTRHVHNLMKSQLYTYLGSVGGLVLLPLSVVEFDRLCTQFKEKQLCTLVA